MQLRACANVSTIQPFDQPQGEEAMETKNLQSTVLVLGARGRFGLATALAFRKAGWRVLGQTRPGAVIPEAATGSGIEWLGIDLTDPTGLCRAAQGVAVVVHALNPSAYTLKAWRREVLPMTDAAIDVARALNATLMVPGNVYNFGASMPPLLREDTPQQATSVKGQIRVAMEHRLKASGIKTVVIRAGDFFGSGKDSWFDMFVAKNIRQGRVTYPGPLDVPTAWAYLPDLARSFVAVAERRDQLPLFEVLHFGGFSVTGKAWLDTLTPIAQTQGWLKADAALAYKRLPWPLLRLMALVNPLLASLMEMRYLWGTPHALTNDKLVALIGPEPHTPFDLAVKHALVDLGMLPSLAAHPALALA
jgi:nucleoside-diphosphate-sugar epimerase